MTKIREGQSQWDINYWIPYRMWRIARHVAHRIRQVSLSKHGLKPALWRALANIGSGAPMSGKELSESIGLDPVQTSRAVDQLVRKGLVTRGVDARDRRRVQLRLSRKGQDVFKAIAPVAGQIQAELFAQLSESEIDQFKRILDKMELSADTMWAEYSIRKPS